MTFNNDPVAVAVSQKMREPRRQDEQALIRMGWLLWGGLVSDDNVIY